MNATTLFQKGKVIRLCAFLVLVLCAVGSVSAMNKMKSEAAEGIHLGNSISTGELNELTSNIGTMGAIFRKLSYFGLYDNYQRSTNLTHDIYCGYFANLRAPFYYRSPSYEYDASWSDHRWNHFYSDRTIEYGELARSFWFVDHDFTGGTGTYLNAFYITRIYYAFLISTMTDTYGDLPLSDKHLQGIPDPRENSPAYRTQEEVFELIFDMLEDALQNMKPNQVGAYNLGDDDRCYGGDVYKWLRFANTLRLRLALRISNANPVLARRQGEAALANEYGLMQDQADNMKTIPNYAPVALGGENSGGDENIHALCSYSWSDAGMNKDLEVAYKTLSSVLDPRCEVSWYRPLATNSTVDVPIETTLDFLGSVSGDSEILGEATNPFIRYNKYSRLRSHGLDGKTLRDDAWFGLSRESVWLSYAESRFLLAEAALRTWSGTSKTAYAYFIEGIQASLSYYKIPASKQQEYLDGLAIHQAGNNPFLTTNRELMLEQIITQKWIAVFPNGNEGWAEFRRTDYPSFIALPLYNGSWDVPQGKFIKRISYPGEESLINENFPFLEEEVFQGDRLWWDVADTNDDNGVRVQPDNFREVISEVQLPEAADNRLLSLNYPNPFSSRTTFSYSIEKPGDVLFRIYDVSGKLINELSENNKQAGNYKLVIQADQLTNGVYYLQMTPSNGSAVTRKMVVSK